jgi:hypothetical protein
MYHLVFQALGQYQKVKLKARVAVSINTAFWDLTPWCLVTGVSEVRPTSGVRVEEAENSFETLDNNIPDHTTYLRRQYSLVI